MLSKCPLKDVNEDGTTRTASGSPGYFAVQHLLRTFAVALVLQIKR